MIIYICVCFPPRSFVISSNVDDSCSHVVPGIIGVSGQIGDGTLVC